MGDFAGNGVMDVAVSRREPLTAYWFERMRDDLWVQHEIGKSRHLELTLGAAAVDVDQDGWLDVVFSGVWFRNPGTLATQPDARWQPFEYDGGGHDIVAADVNGDGKQDIITYDGKVLAWFDTSNGLAKTVIDSDRNDHGGVAPHGFGDISGNGLLDIVLAGHWYENPGGDGYAAWKKHPWPHVPIRNSTYGASIRSWVADMNATGLNDIVYSDFDTSESHLY